MQGKGRGIAALAEGLTSPRASGPRFALCIRSASDRPAWPATQHLPQPCSHVALSYMPPFGTSMRWPGLDSAKDSERRPR